MYLLVITIDNQYLEYNLTKNMSVPKEKLLIFISRNRRNYRLIFYFIFHFLFLKLHSYIYFLSIILVVDM